jgi:hypothetical protein
MRWFPDSPAPGEHSADRAHWAAIYDWSRRVHYFVGLYLLFFVWLFCFTGLLLNHPKWKFAEFWENRKQSTAERRIVVPAARGDLAQARDIMTQLGISGEIDWTTSRPDQNHLDFRVSRPGKIFEIKTDLSLATASIHRIDLNGWGVTRILHTFTGVRLDDSRNRRDWAVTTIWALSMDAVAAGLIFLVGSSLVLWCDRARNRALGGLSLLLGTIVCGLFCYGLRWLY